MVELFIADDGPALGESAAAQEGAFFALPDDKLALFALVALYSGRLGGRLRGQDVALLVELQGGLAGGVVAASEEGSEAAASEYHGLSADGAFMVAFLWFEHFSFFVAGTGELAFGIGRAT